MPQVESRDNFIPTDHERRVLLELIQSPQESLESIAHELKITLAALTIYLATDDAATLFAQADLANARRARTAAAAHLEKCVGALALIIDDFVSDITHNIQRETPKSRREQDRQKETTRRAATVLYRIANFTPKVLSSALHSPSPREGAGGWVPPAPVNAIHQPQSQTLPKTNPTRKRGATPVTIAPSPPENQSLPTPASKLPALTSPERERAGLHASPSAIRHPTSDIPPTSPERERAASPASPSAIRHPTSDIPTTPHPSRQSRDPASGRAPPPVPA
ncbi:MAG: hypothetical protein K2Y21_02450 [Phycisphaerales bacterium]|nr:hypothetical protein [Phycisphaerales bacterium]